MIQTRQRASRVPSRSVSQPLHEHPDAPAPPLSSAISGATCAERKPVGPRKERRVPRHHRILGEAMKHSRHHVRSEGACSARAADRGEQRRGGGPRRPAGVSKRPRRGSASIASTIGASTTPIAADNSESGAPAKLTGQPARAGIAHHQPCRQGESPRRHGGGAALRRVVIGDERYAGGDAARFADRDADAQHHQHGEAGRQARTGRSSRSTAPSEMTMIQRRLQRSASRAIGSDSVA